jgi:hypothetical protein
MIKMGRVSSLEDTLEDTPRGHLGGHLADTLEDIPGGHP